MNAPRCVCIHGEELHDRGPCRGGNWALERKGGEVVRMRWYFCECPLFRKRREAGDPRVTLEDHEAYLAAFESTS